MLWTSFFLRLSELCWGDKVATSICSERRFTLWSLASTVADVASWNWRSTKHVRVYAARKTNSILRFTHHDDFIITDPASSAADCFVSLKALNFLWITAYCCFQPQRNIASLSLLLQKPNNLSLNYRPCTNFVVHNSQHWKKTKKHFAHFLASAFWKLPTPRAATVCDVPSKNLK